MIDLSGNVNLEKTVNVLGLNKNPMLVAERKAKVSEATNKKRAVLRLYGKDRSLYERAINKLCKKYATKIDNKLKPYSFVLISALKIH